MSKMNRVKRTDSPLLTGLKKDKKDKKKEKQRERKKEERKKEERSLERRVCTDTEARMDNK